MRKRLEIGRSDKYAISKAAGKVFYYSNFAAPETEIQKRQETCSLEVIKVGFESDKLVPEPWP